MANYLMRNGGTMDEEGNQYFSGPATYSKSSSSGSVTMPINNDAITAQFTALFASARSPQEQESVRRQYATALANAQSANNPNPYEQQQERARIEQERRDASEYQFGLQQRQNAAADTRTQGQYTQNQFNQRNDPNFAYLQNPGYQHAMLQGATGAAGRGDMLGNNPAYRPNPFMAFGGSWGGQQGQQAPQTQPIWNGAQFGQAQQNAGPDQDMIRNYLSRLMGGR